MPQTRRCAFQLHLALHETGFFLIKLTTVLAHAPHSSRTTEPAKILSVPPDNKPTLAHSALLSWLGCHLPRLVAAWGLGTFGLRALVLELSLITNLRQISQPYNWIFLHLTIPILNSTNTGVSRHHLRIAIYLRKGPRARPPRTHPPPREGTVGWGPGLSPIVNYRI